MNIWLETAMRPEVYKRSRRVALLVGSILVVINYFDRIFVGDVAAIDYIKMLMTYCVPYCVSTHASVSAILEQKRLYDNEQV